MVSNLFQPYPIPGTAFFIRRAFILYSVIPDLIGDPGCFFWIPAFAGMTNENI
jgi:hypothetical protein